MKRIINFAIIAAAALLAFAGCVKEQGYDTDQYGSAPTLSAFAPNPVFRGGELTFLGSNLEQVTSVKVPGVDEITAITVEATGRKSRIKITLPNSTEEVGVVKLTCKDGTVLTTLTELTYTEPIVFSSFSPASAMPGDVITIKGDYMNLVREVIFESGVIVAGEDILSQDRYTLTCKVPANAVTGRLIVGDSDELADPDNVANKVYSEKELAIGDPTVSSLSVSTPKPGNAVSIKGAYLQMIKTVVFADGVEVSDFEVSADGKTLTVAIPDVAKSGDVNVVDFAGKSFTAGAIEMVKPGNLSTSPAPVKAGEILTVSGDDLDVVSAVSVAGAGNVDFVAENGKISFIMPAKAAEGNVTLTSANGDAVEVAYTLVHPTVTEVAPVALMAGDSITVYGTDLDLITGVTLGGKEESFRFEGGALIVRTGDTSVSGKLVLKLANGETVEPGEEITLSYKSLIIVSSMPEAAHIGETVTLKGERFLMLENIFIGDEKVTLYTVRNDNEISFIMPWNSIGQYPVKFQLLNGDEETCPQQIEVLLEVKYYVPWEGSTQITWSDGGRVLVPAGAFDEIKPGARLRFYYTQVDQQWDQAQVNYGDWSGINFNEAGDGATTFNTTLVPTDVYGWYPDGILDRCTEVILTKEILTNLKDKHDICEDVDCSIIIQGSGLTFTKVEIVQEIPQEVPIWEGSTQITWSDGGRVLIPIEKFAAAKAGQALRLYYTQVDQQWDQAQVDYGDWDGINFTETSDGAIAFNTTLVPTDVYGWFPDGILDRCTKVILTQEIIDNILAKHGNCEDVDCGIIIQGSGLTFTAVTLE